MRQIAQSRGGLRLHALQIRSIGPRQVRECHLANVARRVILQVHEQFIRFHMRQFADQ